MLTRFNKKLFTWVVFSLNMLAGKVAPLIPIIYYYFNDPYPCRGICLNKASPYLVLFTLTCAAPKPWSQYIYKIKKYSAGNRVRLRIPVQESEDPLALLKNHWCILQMCNVEVSVWSTKNCWNYGGLNLDDFKIFGGMCTTLCLRHFGMKPMF